MTFVLSTIQEASQTKFTSSVKLDERDLLVASAHGETLKISEFKPPGLNLIYLYRFPEPIQGLVAITQSKDTTEQFVCVLLSSELHVMKLRGNKLVIVVTISLERVQGHQSCQDIDPVLMGPSAIDSGTLLLYQYTGFVTTIDVMQILNGPSKVPKKRLQKKLQQKQLLVATYSIGNVAVLLMVRVEVSLFAVLCRDIEFKFSLRYYNLDAKMSESYLRHVYTFRNAPSLVFSTGGEHLPHGIVVASDTAFYFFPVSSKLLLGDSLDPSVVKNQGYEMATIPIDPIFLGSSFQCYTRIDQNRYLLVTDRGQTALFYVETEMGNVANTVLKQARVIDLGKSTIATALVAQNNIILATSMSSRSVVFRIATRQPYIEILNYFDEAAPVLDIAIKRLGLSFEYLVARGGFHNGELRKYQTSEGPWACYQLVYTVSNPVGLCVVEVDGVYCARVATIDGYKLFELKKLRAVKHREVSDKYSRSEWEFLRGSLQLLDKEVPVLRYSTETDTKEVALREVKQVSQVVCRQNDGKVTAYVVLWDKELLCVEFSDRGAKIEWRLQIPIEGECTAEITSKVLLIADSQTLYQLHTDTLASQKTSLESGMCRLSASGRHVLLHNFSTVYELAHVPGSDFTIPIEVYSLKVPFVTCEAIPSNNRLRFMILRPDGTLEKFLKSEAGSKVEPLAYFSNNLILRIVPYSATLAIALEMEISPTRHTGSINRLLLFDTLTLQCLHTYEPDEFENIVDICCVKQPRGENRNFIVGLNASDDYDRLFSIFIVSKNRISKLDYLAMPRIKLPRKLAFHKICSYESAVMVTGISYAEFVLTRTYDDLYYWSPTHLDPSNTEVTSGIPHYGVDICMTADCEAVADAANGVYVGDASSTTLQKAILEFQPSFLSALALVEGAKNAILYGDSAGNLCLAGRSGLVMDSRYRTMIACNIGEHINSIKVVQSSPLLALVGTAKGGIYSIGEMEITENTLRRYEELRKAMIDDGLDYGKRLGKDWKNVDGSVQKLHDIEVLEGDVIREACKDAERFEIADEFSSVATHLPTMA